MGDDNKMRATSHNGRVGKDGAYSPKHNDRNGFEAEHIDAAKSAGNRYWHIAKKNMPNKTFEEIEKAFYEIRFRAALDAKNERYKKNRHPERCQTMDEYRSNPRTCPEETILQVGKAGQTIDPDLLWQIACEQVVWEGKHFPNVKILDLALHVDEAGAPHVHERKVWIGHDAEGNPVVGQSKALQEMDILPPRPDKKYGRNNNAKMTYTAMCREHLLQLCAEHGLEIEEDPKDASLSGLSLIEYKAKQEAAKLQESREQLQDIEKKLVETFRMKEMAEADLELQNVLKAASEPLKSDFEADDVEILATTQYRPKTRFSEAREATVTISKADYDKLQEAARLFETQQRLQEISATLQEQLDALQIDLIDKHTSLENALAEAQDDRLELVRKQTRAELQRAAGEIAKLNSKIAELNADVDSTQEWLEEKDHQIVEYEEQINTYMDICEFFPVEWDEMQHRTQEARYLTNMYLAYQFGQEHDDIVYSDSGKAYFKINGEYGDISRLFRTYIDTCKENGIQPTDRMRAAILDYCDRENRRKRDDQDLTL